MYHFHFFFLIGKVVLHGDISRNCLSSTHDMHLKAEGKTHTVMLMTCSVQGATLGLSETVLSNCDTGRHDSRGH